MTCVNSHSVHSVTVSVDLLEMEAWWYHDFVGDLYWWCKWTEKMISFWSESFGPHCIK